jgi:hypothetical protein
MEHRSKGLAIGGHDGGFLIVVSTIFGTKPRAWRESGHCRQDARKTNSRWGC